MLRKLSILVAIVVGVVALKVINDEFRPKIDPEGMKKQEAMEKELKEARELRKEATEQRKKEAEERANQETVDVAHILIMASGDEAAWAKAKEKIDAARARVIAGEDFSKVARDVSEDPGSKQNGGAYPGTPHGMMVPEFDKVMFDTPVGQVSEPFRTSYGWHILTVTGRHGNKQPADPKADTKTDAKTDPKADAKADPKADAKTAAVPDTFKVKFETTKGVFIVECHKDWAPLGAAHFYELVQQKYYDDNKFFRVVPGFVIQWGLAGDPAVTAKWVNKNIQDEPVKEPNKLGTVSFAKSNMPNSRSTQLFVNLADNSGRLDGMGFAAFGKVIEGMDVVNALNAKYGQKPDQDEIKAQGNAYLNAQFPDLDGIKTAQIIP